MNKQSSGALGIAILLGSSSLAFSCLSDPSPPDDGNGGAGMGGESPGGNVGGAGESGGGGLAEGGGLAQGGAAESASGAAGESGSAGEGGATSGAGGDSGVGGSDVVGTVVDGEGVAVASAKVEIAGQLVMTDELGRFTVHHVPDTYSAVIVFVPPPVGMGFPFETQTVDIYDELTTRNPHFKVEDLPIDPPNHGGIVGSVSGGAGFPMPDDRKNRFVATVSNSCKGCQEFQELVTPTTYGFPVLYWGAEPANKYTVGGLQWREDVNGMPTHYDGWASGEVVLLPAKYYEATLDLVLAPVESRTVTGTITKPTDCTPAVEGKVGAILVFDDIPTTSTFSYLMPEPLSGATTALVARCSWAGGRLSSVSVGLDDENNADLAVPSPPSLIHPSDEGTGVTYATPFSWDAGDHLLRTIRFQGGGWKINRHGTGESSTLPDLTRFGIAIPPGSSFQWQVVSLKVDDGASTTWDDVLGTQPYDPPGTGQSIFRGDSQQWEFTLTP